jgi:hypothetical protein
MLMRRAALRSCSAWRCWLAYRSLSRPGVKVSGKHLDPG